MLQPGAILDMEVYHNELKSIQRIKEINWSYVYKDLLSDVIKNSILVYLLELLNKCLKQPEENSELFDFCEDALITLDEAEKIF
jgi:DNA repair protein RecO (recombination protein O)